MGIIVTEAEESELIPSKGKGWFTVASPMMVLHPTGFYKATLLDMNQSKKKASLWGTVDGNANRFRSGLDHLPSPWRWRKKS